MSSVNRRGSPAELIVLDHAQHPRQADARCVDIIEEDEDVAVRLRLDEERQNALQMLHVSAALAVGRAVDVTAHSKRRAWPNVHHTVELGVVAAALVREDDAAARLEVVEVAHGGARAGCICYPWNDHQHI